MSELRRLPPITPHLVGPAHGPPTPRAIIAGPLCTPLDTWSRSSEVPPLRRGDIVQVPNVGAYGLSASLLAFLSHPTPYEVVVDRGEVVDRSHLEIVRCTNGSLP